MPFVDHCQFVADLVLGWLTVTVEVVVRLFDFLAVHGVVRLVKRVVVCVRVRGSGQVLGGRLLHDWLRFCAVGFSGLCWLFVIVTHCLMDFCW